MYVRVRALTFDDMAKQEIWIRLQADLKEGYSLLRSLIDNGGNVCGIDRDRCRLLFGRLRDIREKKSIQIEFDDLPDDEKSGRAKKMLEVLGQYHLGEVKVREYPTDEEIDGMSEQEIDNYVKHVFDDVRDYSQKVWFLDTEAQRWEKDFSCLIYEVETFVLRSFSAEEGADSGGEPQQYTEELLDFFKGNIDLIDKLKFKDRGTVVWMVTHWSEEGKCKNIVDFGKKRIAKLLIENRVVMPKQEDIAKDAESFRKKF